MSPHVTPTERDKMLSGAPYRADDSDLAARRTRARALCARYNHLEPGDSVARRRILDELMGKVGDRVTIEPPFYCDYGANLILSDDVYFNTGCVVLDCGTVEIGPGAKLGPGVQIATAFHPTDPDLRRTGVEMARPIRIGANAWIGAGAILCPGVEIGDDTTVGAGSVVTRSLPAGVVAAGTPCRVIRPARP
ncbi:MAG: sugar O-acetyltransferase [Isosphaeraceae bacterium]